ncbi:hypothetical protein EYF80_012920 [Liparis tanakae]|uniref:Uncharacterized protein n=1 Tax=Liparis tanakae TaxID=230148 RepID=A0A4Z2IGF6_9TELE|nr:hypothetical protein EYF80_012920 [Liparis tanakae]
MGFLSGERNRICLYCNNRAEMTADVNLDTHEAQKRNNWADLTLNVPFSHLHFTLHSLSCSHTHNTGVKDEGICTAVGAQVGGARPHVPLSASRYCSLLKSDSFEESI